MYMCLCAIHLIPYSSRLPPVERPEIGTESVTEIEIVIVIEDEIGIGITIERGEESATTGIVATEGGTPGRTGTGTETDGGKEAGAERGMTGDDTRTRGHQHL